jgi:hypothetical protein
MCAAIGQVSAQEIVELDRISCAQLAAVKAGNFEEVRLLLGTRQSLLDRLRGRAVARHDLEHMMASDGETLLVLRAQIMCVEAELARLNRGGRALEGYAVKGITPPGFVEHVR